VRITHSGPNHPRAQGPNIFRMDQQTLAAWREMAKQNGPYIVIMHEGRVAKFYPPTEPVIVSLLEEIAADGEAVAERLATVEDAEEKPSRKKRTTDS